MYNFKKIAAFGLALTMVVGSSVTAFAEGETTTDHEAAVTTAKEVVGTGAEEYVNKNVMKVTTPTDTLIAKYFDYKLDPQGLVAGAKSYDGTAVTGTATGIVFLNNNKGKYTISNTSDAFVVTNKSSIPVDLGVEVQLTVASGGIALDTLATSSDFTGSNAGKTIYLGLKATNDVERALNGTATHYDATLLSGESQYESKWDTTANKYVWAEKTGAKFSDFTFTVTGAMNKTLENKTWATVASDGQVTTKNPPKVSLKFTLAPVKDSLPLTLKWTTDSDKNDILQIGMTNAPTNEGGFTSTNQPTKLYLNGREIATAKWALDTKEADTHYILVKLDDLIAGYSSKPLTGDGAITTKEKSEIKALIKSAKTTKGENDPIYYGQF